MKRKVKIITAFFVVIMAMLFGSYDVKADNGTMLSRPWNMNNMTIEEGCQVDLSAMVYSYKYGPSYRRIRTYEKVTFDSSNKNVAAIINEGILEAVGKGTTTITARLNSETVKFPLTVVKAEYTKGVSVKNINKKIDTLLAQTKNGNINKTNRFSLLQKAYAIEDERKNAGVREGVTIGDLQTGMYWLYVLPNYDSLLGYDGVFDCYAKEYDPLASKGKYIFNVSKVDALQREVIVNLKSAITEDQIYGLQGTYADIQNGKERKVSSYGCEIKLNITNDNGISYELRGMAKQGKRTIVFHPYKGNTKSSMKVGTYRAQWWPTAFKVKVNPSKKVGDTVTIDGMKYKIIGNNAVSCAVKNTKIVKAIIPNTVEIEGKTYNVKEIQKNGFKNCARLRTVIIGSNVEKIGESAFNSCGNLNTIKITALKTIVGKNAFKKINKRAIIYVPYSKLSGYKKNLIKKGLPKTVKITSETIAITDANASYTYEQFVMHTGNQTKPTVKIKYMDGQQGSELKEGVDYKLSYTNNVNPGIATITVTYIGKFRGTKVLSFEIISKDIMLKYDSEKMKKVGTQKPGTKYCKAYAMAYYKVVTTNTEQKWEDYWLSSGQAAGSAKIDCISDFRKISAGDTDYYKAVVEELKAGRPCIMYVTQKSGGEHWVLVIGYKYNKEEPVMDDFVFYDSIPRGGNQIVTKASDYYSGLREASGERAGNYILVRKKT